MKISMLNMPHFIKNEMEKLEVFLDPMTRKATKLSFWSLPLIFYSFFNLFFLLFIIPEKNRLGLIIYALIGAIGWALSKEAKLQRKEILKHSVDYIINRINKSDVVSNTTKQKYTTLVKDQSLRSIGYFIEFLEEENRSSKISYY